MRLPGLEARAPRRLLLTSGAAPAGWERVGDPRDIASLKGVDHVLVEGGAATAAAFLDADLVDRILWYRAPIIYSAGRDVAADLGLDALDPARWRLADKRKLGPDTLEIHSRIR